MSDHNVPLMICASSPLQKIANKKTSTKSVLAHNFQLFLKTIRQNNEVYLSSLVASASSSSPWKVTRSLTSLVPSTSKLVSVKLSFSVITS